MKVEKQAEVHPIIRQIVDRCHVGQSNLSVVRYAKSRLKKGFWRTMTRANRREFVRQVIAVHAENRELYSCVIAGRF